MAKGKKVVRTRSIYKKRRSPNKAIKVIFFIVLIALLIGFGFIVMREWSLRFGENAPKNPSSEIQNSSINGSSSDVSSDTSSQSPVNQTGFGKTSGIISAADLMTDKASFEQKLAKIKSDGHDGVCIELKSDDGMLSYKSTNEMALKYGAVSPNAIELKDAVKAITDAGLTPIAILSTLKDTKASHVRNENSYAFSKTLSVNWLDNSVDKGGKSWLNPYMDNTRLYISGLVKEVSEAGITGIILNNVIFPEKNTGSMNTIKTTPSRPEILKQLLDEAQAAVENKARVFQGVDAAVFYGLNDKGNASGPVVSGYKSVAPIIDFEKYGKLTLENGKLKSDVAGFNPETDALNTTELLLSKMSEFVDTGLSAKDTWLMPIFYEGKFRGAAEKGAEVLKRHGTPSYIVG